jgi:hypothetical protein
MSTCHCDLGLSARAIAYAGHIDHPHDPADLKRCIDYCVTSGITVEGLRTRMAGRSPQWDALLPHWGELAGMLADEMATRSDGCVPLAYARMRDLLDGEADR